MAEAEGSKRFPFINLEKAIARAQELYDADQRGNEMGNEGAFAVWAYSPKSSGGFQTLAALRSYGLLVGEEAGKVKLSKEAFDYFRDEREEARSAALQAFALQPRFLRSLWDKWGAHPPADALARTYLKLERALNEQSARSVLGIYKDNLAYANLKGDAKVTELDHSKGHRSDGQSAKAKIGDFVQWTSNGVDQFPSPRPVSWVAEDRSHLRVVGSTTGIPMNEVQVTQPPAPKANPLVEKPISEGPDDEDAGTADISVLLAGKRLQITADVDDRGLAKLKQMLDKYDEILKLLK